MYLLTGHLLHRPLNNDPDQVFRHGYLTHRARDSSWSVYSLLNVSCSFSVSYLVLNTHPAVVVLFSFIVLVLAAHLRHITHALRDNYYYDFSPLAIAVSIITILAIIPLYISLTIWNRFFTDVFPYTPFSLVIDHLRVGAFTSKIIVELAVLGMPFMSSAVWFAKRHAMYAGLLAILWLATGADTSSHGNFLNGCTLFDCELSSTLCIPCLKLIMCIIYL